MAGKRTNEEIENLKANWRRDPIWELEDSEGFEDCKGELKAYSDTCKAEWEEKAKKAHEKLERMVCPILSIGVEGYGYCRVENCAWWNDTMEKCGVIVESYLKGLQIAREER